jgi:carboxypeptidase C (cathepsin A)
MTQLNATRRCLIVLAVCFCVAIPAWATDAPEAKPDGKDAAPEKTDAPAPTPAITHHRIVIAGKTIAYTASAATIDLKNDAGDAIGRMFYVAYTADVRKPSIGR